MKKIILSFIIFLICTTIFPQSNKEFVEVIAEDTMQVEPEEIQYSLYILKDDNADSVSRSQIVLEEKIKSLINELHIDTIRYNQQAQQYDPYSQAGSTKFILLFTSKNKFISFLSQIKNIDDVNGFITKMESSKIDSHKEDLTMRLLLKAEKDANSIALKSKKTLGKLLSVKEQEIPGDWAVYPPLSAMGHVLENHLIGKIIITKKIIVRYAWREN